MPAIDPAAPRQDYKFKGKKVSVPQHYKTGDVMTENDAKFGNRQLASALGNVLASAINRLVDKKTAENAKLADTDTAKQKNPDGSPKLFGLDDITDAEAQTMFDTIYGDYEIGVNNRGDGTGGAVHDPATAIANNIAWERVKGLLRDRNIKIGSIKADKKTELVADMLRRDPSIMEAAKSQVGAVTPDEGLDSLFAGLPTGDAPAPVPPGPSTEVAASGSETVAGTEGADSVPAAQGSDTVLPGSDTVEGGASAVEGGVIGSETAPAGEGPAVPASEPNSTAEVSGEDTTAAGSNPGTLASPQPEEGTGQGPTDDAAPSESGGKGAFA